jgi:cytochrome c-type biogenesis protein CcmH
VDQLQLTDAGFMIFWIICALVTTSVVLVLLRPLIEASGHMSARAEADIQVYRDQLDEIERDVGRGLIEPEDAESARLEISRRILAAHDGMTDRDIAAGVLDRGERPLHSMLAYSLAAFLVVGSLLAYLWLGTPGQPGTIHAERVSQDPRTASLTEQIARVEARLGEFPEDATGWEVIAPVYLKLGRNAEAANAFRQVLNLKGPDTKQLSGYTQARLAMTKGVVAKDIREAFEQLIELAPNDVPARFWLAMAKEQDGDRMAAAVEYRKLYIDPKISEQFRGVLAERLAAVDAALPEAGAADRAMRRSPEAAGVEDIAKLPEGEQRKAIAGMVESLAARLASDGNDADGWLRLIRAYAVLGQREKAITALSAARKAMTGRSEELDRIKELADVLGLSG